MPQKQSLKYSSEGIPFPPNMGMDEKDGNILFYDHRGEFTEENKRPRAFINLEKKTLTFYSRDEEKWKTVDYSSVINLIVEVLSDIKNGTDRKYELVEISKKMEEKDITPHLKNISDACIVSSVGERYTHYKLFMSQ